MTNATYRRLSVSAQSTWKKSAARSTAAWARRNTRQDPVLVENPAVAVDLVFHAGCRYSLISPASLGRSWIWSIRTGKGRMACTTYDRSL
jgi:hypothetical protein